MEYETAELFRDGRVDSLIDSAPSKNSAQENTLNVTSSPRDRGVLRNNISGCIRKQRSVIHGSLEVGGLWLRE